MSHFSLPINLETVSFFCDHFTDTNDTFTVAESLYLKRNVPFLQDYYYIEETFVSFNTDLINRINHLVETPEFGPNKKPHYSFVLI